MKDIKIFKNNAAILLLVLLACFMVQCEPEALIPKKEVADMQIMEFVEDDSVNYSEFFKIAEFSEMSGILSTRGPFTLFLPDNTALKAYYELKGKNNYTDFSKEELIKLVRNHVVAAEISTSDIGLGSLSEKNAIGDYLVSEFDGSDIVMNKYSYIIDRDIYVANGIIHKVSKVIDPVVEGTFTVISKTNVFSIFAKGLELAGLKDTLQLVEIPYGATKARVRYTILAVPDSVFNANGIYSVEDLVARYDDGVDGLADIDNGFYKYMEYHCLENTNFLSTFEEGMYFVVSRNNYLFIEVGNEFSINPIEGSEEITTFIDKYSNIPTKNGVIHCINKLLPAEKPEAREFFFDTTTFPEFMELDIYRDGVRNFYDGVNGFAKVKWTGDYLQYWAKGGTPFINGDCITMSDGFWTLEVTMPRIPRGKYKVFGNFKVGYNRANVIMYLDGVRIEQVLELNDPNLEFRELEICDVDWKTTQEHTVKLVTVYPGVIMWDNLRFEPIE